jgi:hypothetical protein
MKLPLSISNEERIVRTLYSPINFNKKNGNLQNNAFQSPAGKDEVSVNRLNYTTATFCKELGKKFENPSKNRSYKGFAVLDASEIRIVDAEVLATPINENNLKNPFHGDIKIGYIKTKGNPLPSEYNRKVRRMKDISRLYNDPKLNSEKWEGEDLV